MDMEYEKYLKDMTADEYKRKTEGSWDTAHDTDAKREFVYELIRAGVIGANTSNVIEEYLDSLE